LFAPAIVIDLVLQRWRGRLGALPLAGLLGLAFVVPFVMAQWPFASFLVESPLARNAIFNSENFTYWTPPTSFLLRHQFASADVGSPNVIFDGDAGPYGVRVIVRPPMVVPGLADIIVRVRAPDVSRVVIRPVFWRAGTAGAPTGDVAARVPGDSSTYAGQL